MGTSGGTNFGTKAERKLQQPPTERVYRNVGKLARITKNKIDQEALHRMDTTGYLDPMRILTEVKRFEENITGVLPSARKVSRFMLRHAPELVGQGTMAYPRHPLAYAMPIFTTPKKNEELRLIQNCNPLNRVYKKPPAMDLPLIHDLIDKVLSHTLIGQADGVSYFYQFVMIPEVAAYFGARLGDGRGSYIDLVMQRMAMGFSWAPMIGQRTSNVLIRGLGVAWVDNYIVLGHGKADFDEKATEFLTRAKTVNLELDSTVIKGKTRDVALGIEFDLVKKLYRMDPEWIEKAVSRIEDLLARPQMSILELYTVAGTLIWHHHVTRHELCNVPHLLAGVGRAAQAVAKGHDWGSEAAVTAELRAEIVESLSILRKNVWKAPRRTTEPTVDIWSDASDTHWAFLLFAKDTLVAAKQGSTKADDHIFYSELSVALGGLAAAHRLGHESAVSHIDNAAAAGALQRGASSNYRANRWLSGRAPTQTRVQWVSTHDMLADPYTRVPRGHTAPVPLPPLGTTLQEARELLCKNQAMARKEKSLRRPEGWDKQQSFDGGNVCEEGV